MTTNPSAITMLSNYAIDYPPNTTLNILPSIITQNVTAARDELGDPKDLVLGASSNVELQFTNALQLTQVDGDTGNYTQFVSVYLDNSNMTHITPDNRELEINDLQISAEDNRLFLSTYGSKSEGLFVKDATTFERSTLTLGNTTVLGNVTGNTLNVWKWGSNFSNPDVAEIGYGFRVTDKHQLELLKVAKFANSTKVVNKVAVFGSDKTVSTGCNDSSYLVFDELNGISQAGLSNTDGVPVFAVCNLTMSGTTTVKGDLVPNASDVYSLGGSNAFWKDIYANNATFSGTVSINEMTFTEITASNVSACNISALTATTNSLTSTISSLSNATTSLSNAYYSGASTTTLSNAFYNTSNATASLSNAYYSGGSTVSLSNAFYNTSNTVTYRLDNLSNTVVTSNVTVSGSIVPTQNSVQTIGTSNMHFKEAWIDTVHISANTLYIGNTPVLGTSDETIQIKADPDQSINIKTTGTGSTLMTSQKDVNISSSGMNGQVLIQSTGAGGSVAFGAHTSIAFTAPSSTFTGTVTTSNVNVNGNLVVTGTAFTANVETVTIKDNIMVLNNGEIGNGVTAGKSGLRIDRGDAVDQQLVFDETDDLFKIGPIGSEEAIATRNWVGGSLLTKSSNLLDLANASSARSNLGLGTTDSVTFAAITASNLTASNISTSNINALSTLQLSASNQVKLAIDSNINVSASIVPTANEVYDLGTSNMRFRDLFLSGNTIHIGSNYTISASSNNNGISIVDVQTSSPAPLVAKEFIISNNNVQKVLKVDPVSQTIKFVNRNTTTGIEIDDFLGDSNTSLQLNATSNAFFTSSNTINARLTALETAGGGGSVNTINFAASNITACNIALATTFDSAMVPSYTWVGDSNTGMYHPASDVIGFTTGGIERMRVDTIGNFGIGTTAPSKKLHVHGTDSVLFTAPNNAAVAFSNASGAGDVAFIGSATDYTSSAAAGDMVIRNRQTNKALHLMTGTGAATMTIYNGNVGIGTTLPGYKLDTSGGIRSLINNNSAINEIVIGNDTTTGSTLTGYTQLSIETGNSWTWLYKYGHSTNKTFNVRNNDSDIRIISGSDTGTNGVRLALNATSWSAMSDIRLKKNIRSLEYGLSNILQLTPIRFNYSNDTDDDSSRLGFSAQELQQSMPELVSINELDYLAAKTTDMMIPTLVNAIKELNQRLNILEEWKSTHST